MIKLLKLSYSFLFKRFRWWTLALMTIGVLAYIVCLPTILFQDPICTVLTDEQDNLLGAKIASDGQWRFPHTTVIPQKFVIAITTFEDKRFFNHWGVDLRSLFRACYQNIQQGRTVSGASTITMQVIRLSRKGKARTFYEKFIEIILATRLEWRYSKEEILALYASNAPFGGNVVGLETASWRYYGKRPNLLTWAEAATLAVLPNSPALIHPGRNRTALLNKRNRLLDKLFALEILDELSWELAKEESLPEKPLALPRLTPHLLDRIIQEEQSPQKWTTTIDIPLQIKTNQIIEKHHELLKGNNIHNAAALIIDIEKSTVLAYVGNILKSGSLHGAQVDVITAPRSTGSILKPFLYAGLLQSGQILPKTLIPDLPTQMSGYQPKNFHETYDGVVPANRALIRSLNVPFIRLLQRYGLEKFHFLLKQLRLSTINRPANYYGLPLILGGAEGTLWDLTNAYAGMARTLNHFQEFSGEYSEADFQQANYIVKKEKESPNLISEAPILNAASIYFTFEAMQQVERPNSTGAWQSFQSSQNIAWKTGTSIGFRDGWAIGVTPRYAVGVWVGNADGEGRPELTGIQAAAPILFDMFDFLPTTPWFDPPYDEMTTITTCSKSGYRALDICPTDSLQGPIAGLQVAPCPYHKTIHLDSSGTWQVNSQCATPLSMQHKPWFVLPPGEAHYYRFRSPIYQPLPAFRPDCEQTISNANTPIQMIYPTTKKQIYVPVDINGNPSRTVFKIAHQNPETIVYWHLDNSYLGSTQTFHELGINPEPGPHTLTVIDEHGFSVNRHFEIIGRKD